MKYIVSYTHPHKHLIDITLITPTEGSPELFLQLPAWRPGRYELGNFAKNIQKWTAFDEKGQPLKFVKQTKDLWQVHCKGAAEVHVKYNYYSTDLNAGSTFLDASQLYMNPVNCCMYVVGQTRKPCEMDLILPDSYRVAVSMRKGTVRPAQHQGYKVHTLHAESFDELADSPLIASPTLQHNTFVLDGVEFNLWFQGECRPAWSKIINDFFIFINEQFVMMKEFVHDEYHFLFQILPHKIYHGVEHLKSTVIALGPGYKLNEGELYEDLLGVSSHELYHAWNIKSIRPAEMHPYDYTKENYSRLGYVCEGVTTYYGDLFLFRSGVYSEEEYLKTFHERLQKHFDNPGRYNLSVADSSFDTWLDGYVPGIPGRKTSIYDEGCLIAFMTDMIIRRNTGNAKSLDDVMRALYYDYFKKGKGYTDADYKQVVEGLAGEKLDDFFQTYIYGATSYEKKLSEMADYIGMELKNHPSRRYYEGHYGFRAHHEGHHFKVTAVYPGSGADKAGLTVNDEILAVNGYQLKDDLHDWTRYFHGERTRFSLLRQGVLLDLFPEAGADEYFRTYFLQKRNVINDSQRVAYEAWARRKF